jgi:hypothetical protein
VDAIGSRAGSPGIGGGAQSSFCYGNLKVTANQ